MQTQKKYFRLYAKFQGQKQFKALDISSGCQVVNLIYATLISEDNLKKLDLIIQQNKDVKFEVRPV